MSLPALSYSNIGVIGTHADEQRRSHLRVDNEIQQHEVEAAQRKIFVYGLGTCSMRIYVY